MDEKSITKNLLLRLRQIVSNHPGDRELRFRVKVSENGHKKELLISAHKSFYITPSQEILNEMQELLGPERVHFVYNH